MSDQFAALSEMLKGFKSNLESQTEILIKPTTKRNIPPVPPIRLHALDLLMPPINVSLPILFKITPALAADGTSNPKRGIHDEFESIVERLKLALAETLEMYPPIAGTIHASPDDASALTLVCDGRGAAFITKLEDRVYVENENTLPQLAGADIFAMDLKLPIFTVKLSLFSCGTMVMVTSMHHHAADLTSYMDFIGAWARLSRGEGLDMEAIPHSWSRGINLSLSVTVPSSMPGIMILPPPSATATPIPPPSLRICDGLRWFISDVNLTKLKLDCIAALDNHSGSKEKSWISSADAFTALVWGAMTRARQSTPNKVSLYTSNHPEMESMGVAVDGRERIGLGPSTPGGPSKYFGNLNLSLAVYAPRKDLLEVSLEATARVAFAIRKTIQDEMTLEAIAARVAFIEAQVEVTKPHTTQRIVLEGDCRSTNWSKYDLTKFDFGFGDNVKSVHSIVGTKLIYGAGMLLIVKGSGGLVVASTVEKEADAMLEIDPLLRMYAELLPN